jgi:glycosyltransferase involved in cell wall biosynthesis
MVSPVLGKVPAVFDAVDCLSMLESRRRRVTKNPFVKLFSRIEAKKFALSEAEATAQFSRVAISSEVDRAAFPVSRGLREKIHVIPNGVDLEHFGFRRFDTQKKLLVFCAKLDYFPNEDAALFLIEKIWPLLKTRRPQLQLEIVGSRPSRTLRRHNGKNNIRVIGSVPDVRPHVGRASIALCPIRIRAGIQNKMLEAMALGVPLVATSLCCDGLPVVPGKHLLTADDPAQFASAVELLLDNPPMRESIVDSARAYVERHHNWADSVTALSDLYEEAIAGCTTIAA